MERDRLKPEENVELILRVGGLATLAHPRGGNGLEGIEPLLAKLADAGLSAMEVYYQDYPPESIAHLKKLADQFGLIPLGGSDYHGLGGPHQREPGIIPLPMEQVERYLHIARERGALGRAKGPFVGG